jgi:hypothetical protein
MAEAKTIKIKPLVDIVYGGMNHKKGTDAFEVPTEIGNRLIKGKKAEKAE